MTSALFRRSEPSASQIHRLARSADRPLRLLLIRERDGELPWIVQAITRVMAPVELVPVRGLANALWRLGRERFDSVLLDLNPNDRAAAAACRRHIADVAALPVLDLNAEEAEVVPSCPSELQTIPWPPRAGRQRSLHRQPRLLPRASAAAGGD